MKLEIVEWGPCDIMEGENARPKLSAFCEAVKELANENGILCEISRATEISLQMELWHDFS